MPDLALQRLVRAARRAVPSFHSATSAMSAALLAWLTMKAGAEEAPKDSSDVGSDHPETTGAAMPASKAGAGGELVGTKQSEEGAAGVTADAAANGATSDPANGEAASK